MGGGGLRDEVGEVVAEGVLADVGVGEVGEGGLVTGEVCEGTGQAGAFVGDVFAVGAGEDDFLGLGEGG